LTAVDTGANTFTIRAWNKPVYYSGQLGTTNYSDSGYAVKGNNVTYPKGSVVMRLTNFSIYLFRDSFNARWNRDVRQMIRISDTEGIADVLNESYDVDRSIISENIWDMQISYTAYSDFSSATRSTTPDRRFFGGTGTLTTHSDLMLDILDRKLKQIDITVVTLTAGFGGTGATDKTLPIIGDRKTADSLPTGKYGVRITSFAVDPRNYSVIL
jgi:hypothetical protein